MNTIFLFILWHLHTLAPGTGEHQLPDLAGKPPVITLGGACCPALYVADDVITPHCNLIIRPSGKFIQAIRKEMCPGHFLTLCSTKSLE